MLRLARWGASGFSESELIAESLPVRFAVSIYATRVVAMAQIKRLSPILSKSGGMTRRAM